jgi:hypothetical protein
VPRDIGQRFARNLHDVCRRSACQTGRHVRIDLNRGCHASPLCEVSRELSQRVLDMAISNRGASRSLRLAPVRASLDQPL